MKYLNFASALCVLFALLTFAGCSPDTAPDEIRKVMDKQVLAWNKGDIEAFMDGYWRSDSLKFVGKNGITHGWQTTLDNYRSSYRSKEQMGTLEFDLGQIEACGDQAFVLGRWHIRRESGDLGGYFTLYWKKIDGQWKIIIDHTS